MSNNQLGTVGWFSSFSHCKTGRNILAFAPFKTKNPIFHVYKMSCIFADFDARRKPLDKGNVLY